MPAMTPFFFGFGDELTKISARKGLKIIRELVRKGDLAAANKLAKTPGVLKPVTRDIQREGKILLHKGRSPGHQIKHLGAGKEQVATLVADPMHGIVVRKTHRGPSAITVEKQMDLKREFGQAANREGLKSAPKHLEAFTGESGRKMHLQEYVRGSAPKTDSVAAKAALKEHHEFAKKRGFELDDMTSQGNIVVRRGPDGKMQGVVLDPIVTKGGKGGKRAKDPGGRASPGETMKQTFDPSVTELDKYDAIVEARRAAAESRKVRRG